MNLVDSAIERGELLERVRILEIINIHISRYEHCRNSCEDQELVVLERLKKDFMIE